MKRQDFISKFFRYLLLGLLTLIAVIAGSRSTLASDCSSCAGNGICKGESDCSRYIKKK